MPTKKVIINANQAETFKTECVAGKHRVIVDQPLPGGGTDEGPTPLDYQLIALGSCIAAIGRIVANQRKLAIRGFRVTVEGAVNTDGLLGKPTQDRVGFSAIKAMVEIDADLSRAEKTALLHDIDKRCPISDNLNNISPVAIELVG